MSNKPKLGRPRKAESEKIQYQRIAIYKDDYDRLNDKLAIVNERLTAMGQDKMKLTDAFTLMVDKFIK